MRRPALSAVAFALGIGVWTSSVSALPLAEVIAKSKASVAHIAVADESGREVGSGSGFVISDDGKLVTNHHVVAGAAKATAVFADKSRVEVVGVVAYDEQIDIAVLKLASGGRPALTLSETSVKQGENVIVIGSPRGLSGTVSTGIVSAIRETGLPPEGADDYKPSWQLQITAAISPGSSGSPILNEQAQVVGVAVGLHSGGQALNFGIPVARAKSVAVKAGVVKPLSALRTGRSVRTNLIISAVGIGGALCLAWLVGFVMRARKRRTAKAK